MFGLNNGMGKGKGNEEANRELLSGILRMEKGPLSFAVCERERERESCNQIRWLLTRRFAPPSSKAGRRRICREQNERKKGNDDKG